jgi:hypothetical protein
MTRRRFEGAVTTPADSGVVVDASIVPAPERPPRPVLVEVAAALLIVGGLTSLLGALAAPGLAGILFTALNAVMIVLGLLIRRGRAWIVAVNVVAVALFLELTALPSGFAIVSIVMDTIVLIALFRHRAWFFWTPPEDDRSTWSTGDADDAR